MAKGARFVSEHHQGRHWNVAQLISDVSCEPFKTFYYSKLVMLTERIRLDDIEDGSLLRRGRPSVHVLYGQSQTINSANYIYVKSVAKILTLKGATCLEIFIGEGSSLHRLRNLTIQLDELENLHCGQSLDLGWRYCTMAMSLQLKATSPWSIIRLVASSVS